MIFQKNFNSQIESLVLEKEETAEKSEAEIASIENKLVNGNEAIVSLQANMDAVKKTVNSLVDEKSKLLQQVSLKVKPLSSVLH